MRIHYLIVLLICALLILSPLACTPATIEKPIIAETSIPLAPPSSEELTENKFVLPAIPRILCEQLKQMMDRDANFTLVDARSNDNFKRGYLPRAINIPEDDSSPLFMQEWVNEKLTALNKDTITIFYCD
jgi:hypothetical protein